MYGFHLIFAHLKVCRLLGPREQTRDTLTLNWAVITSRPSWPNPWHAREESQCRSKVISGLHQLCVCVIWYCVILSHTKRFFAWCPFKCIRFRFNYTATSSQHESSQVTSHIKVKALQKRGSQCVPLSSEQWRWGVLYSRYLCSSPLILPPTALYNIFFSLVFDHRARTACKIEMKKLSV